MKSHSNTFFTISLALVLVLGLAGGFLLSKHAFPLANGGDEVPKELLSRMSSLEDVVGKLQRSVTTSRLKQTSKNGVLPEPAQAMTSSPVIPTDKTFGGFANRIDEIVESINTLDQRLTAVEYSGTDATGVAAVDSGLLPQASGGSTAQYAASASGASFSSDLVGQGVDAIADAIYSEQTDTAYGEKLTNRINEMFANNPDWANVASFDNSHCSQSACKIELTFGAGLSAEQREEIERGIFSTLASEMPSGQTVYEPAGDGSERVIAYLGR